MAVPRFWREIPQRYNLNASRCGGCGGVHFPPREICPSCRRASLGKMDQIRLSGRGTILEWTRVHKAAPGYEAHVPYILAWIATEEGPVVTGHVVDSEPAAIAAGSHVRAVFRRLGADGESGVIHYGTKWQVVAPPGKDGSASAGTSGQARGGAPRTTATGPPARGRRAAKGGEGGS